MRVTRNIFEKMITSELKSMKANPFMIDRAAIGISPETEDASKRIQRTLFKMGYVWRSRALDSYDQCVRKGIRSIFVRGTTVTLSSDSAHTAEDLLELGGPTKYIVLRATDISTRIDNFE